MTIYQSLAAFVLIGFGVAIGSLGTFAYYHRRAKRFGIHIRTLRKYKPEIDGLFTFDADTTEKIETFFSENGDKQ